MKPLPNKVFIIQKSMKLQASTFNFFLFLLVFVLRIWMNTRAYNWKYFRKILDLFFINFEI